MTSDPDFKDFIRRLRGAEEEAFAELMASHEQTIHKMADQWFRRHNFKGDTDDILTLVMFRLWKSCQEEGDNLQLNSPEDLLRMLSELTRESVSEWIKDMNSNPDWPVEYEKRLAERCRQLLSADCQRLFHLHYVEELTWDQVASLEQSTADICRRKLKREITEIARKLGLETP